VKIPPANPHSGQAAVIARRIEAPENPCAGEAEAVQTSLERRSPPVWCTPVSTRGYRPNPMDRQGGRLKVTCRWRRRR